MMHDHTKLWPSARPLRDQMFDLHAVLHQQPGKEKWFVETWALIKLVTL